MRHIGANRDNHVAAGGYGLHGFSTVNGRSDRATLDLHGVLNHREVTTGGQACSEVLGLRAGARDDGSLRDDGVKGFCPATGVVVGEGARLGGDDVSSTHAGGTAGFASIRAGHDKGWFSTEGFRCTDEFSSAWVDGVVVHFCDNDGLCHGITS